VKVNVLTVDNLLVSVLNVRSFTMKVLQPCDYVTFLNSAFISHSLDFIPHYSSFLQGVFFSIYK